MWLRRRSHSFFLCSLNILKRRCHTPMDTFSKIRGIRKRSFWALFSVRETLFNNTFACPRLPHIHFCTTRQPSRLTPELVPTRCYTRRPTLQRGSRAQGLAPYSIWRTRSTLVPPEMPSWMPLMTTHTSPVLHSPLTLAVARHRAMSEAEPTIEPTTIG
jgi:hypothetical protein